MVTHSFYESDNRVIRYAECLAGAGDHVEVLALRRTPDLPKKAIINGVMVHRIQDRFAKNDGSAWSYLWPLLRFLFVSLRWIARSGRERHFDLVHVHNIPDFLVFAAWPAKRHGARVILDIHDIVPEFFLTKFARGATSPLAHALRLMERVSAGFADHIILSNHLWLKTYTLRSAPTEKCTVFINNVDATIFKPLRAVPRPEGNLILFPGGLQWHQGLDIAIRAFAKLKEELPSARFHIYGDGSSKRELVALVYDLELRDSVSFFDPLPLRDVARIMAEADLAVVPKRADSFGNEAYSTKIMEFMSVGVPVIVSETRIDRYYFTDAVVRFFPSGDVPELARAMYDMLTDTDLRAGLVKNAFAYVERNGWQSRKADYLRLIDSLVLGDAQVAADHVLSN